MLPAPDLSQVRVWGLAVPTQGLLAIVGVAVGLRVWTSRLDSPKALDLGLFSVIGAILGGHAVGLWLWPGPLPWWPLSHPQSSLGALGGGAVMALVLARWWRIPLASLVNAAAWSLVHGWPWVRLGCALVHDHPGRRSTAWLAVQFPDGPRLDMGLLECIASTLFLLIFRALARRPWPSWRLVALTTLQFALTRLVVELLRQESWSDALAFPAVLAVTASVGGLVLAGIFWHLSTRSARLHPGV